MPNCSDPKWMIEHAHRIGWENIITVYVLGAGPGFKSHLQLLENIIQWIF